MTHDDATTYFSQRLVKRGNLILKEYGDYYRPDILTLNRSLEVTEYEIKVGQPSLFSELATIKKVLKEDLAYDEFPIINDTNAMLKNKYAKHSFYLKSVKSPRRYYDYKPNYYYFVVPLEFVDNLKAKIYNLPYGIIDLEKARIRKRASSLQPFAADSRIVWDFAYNALKETS